MQNPWLFLPEASPFVLPGDRESILNFNARAKQDHKIHLELLPEPYLGNPQAKIVLLNGNPGFDEDVHIYHNNANFVKAYRTNLYHERQEYPFYLLNPQFEKSPGFEWRYDTLERLLIQFHYDLKKIANEIFVIEYFPYPSKNFGFYKGILSQQYSFYLLKEAMKRDALIIQMRAKTNWQKMNPYLRSYHRYYVLNSPQNVKITENNCPDGYPEILRALESE